MQLKKCALCSSELLTVGEIVIGLCGRHLSLLNSPDSFVGVCWQCNRITVIEEIPQHLKGAFTEKYLFTKACSHCTGNRMDDVQWVTISKFKPDRTLYVKSDGKLHYEITHSIVKSKDPKPSLDDLQVEDVKVIANQPSVEDSAETELQDNN